MTDRDDERQRGDLSGYDWWQKITDLPPDQEPATGGAMLGAALVVMLIGIGLLAALWWAGGDLD